MPSGALGTLRIALEGSAAIVFMTMLVLLTGGASSPFFFLCPLLVGAAALIASPLVTVLLAAESAVAYAIAAFSKPLDRDAARDALVRVAINLMVLVLLSYAGMIIARVQRRTRETAIRLSTVDSLTDLYTRAYFFNSVDREIQRSRRFKRGFCLLMMDLDGLKSINDRYGHYQGDLVLRGVAHVLRTALRGMDVPARYGGDEFVALLPETEPHGAYVVAENIRRAASEPDRAGRRPADPDVPLDRRGVVSGGWPHGRRADDRGRRGDVLVQATRQEQRRGLRRSRRRDGVRRWPSRIGRPLRRRASVCSLELPGPSASAAIPAVAIAAVGSEATAASGSDERPRARRAGATRARRAGARQRRRARSVLSGHSALPAAV